MTGGKTIIFCRVLEGVYNKGKRGLLVVKGRELVSNASNRLTREGIPHGVIMAGKRNDIPHLINVCSIDTLNARSDYPEADLVVIDEAQDAISPSYKKFLKAYPDVFLLAVSATPHAKNGLRHLADHVVRPTSISELIEQGFLEKPRYFMPSKIDTASVKISNTGDYNQRELAEAVEKADIYGSIVDTYIKHGDNLPAICFAVNVEQSKYLCELFKKNGISATHVDAKTKDDVRKKAIKDLESGEIKVIVNVGIFCVGTDIPCLGNIILARPTKSYNLFLQQCGRGTRLSPGKKGFKIFDHVGSILENGLIENEMDCLLDGWETIKKVSPMQCENCYTIYDPKQNYIDQLLIDKEVLSAQAHKTKRYYVCPECTHETTPKVIERKEKEYVEEDDDLVEVNSAKLRLIEIKSKMKELELKRKSSIVSKTGKGYKKAWTWHQLIGQYGFPEIQQIFKNIPDFIVRHYSDNGKH